MTSLKDIGKLWAFYGNMCMGNSKRVREKIWQCFSFQLVSWWMMARFSYLWLFYSFVVVISYLSCRHKFFFVTEFKLWFFRGVYWYVNCTLQNQNDPHLKKSTLHQKTIKTHIHPYSTYNNFLFDKFAFAAFEFILFMQMQTSYY